MRRLVRFDLNGRSVTLDGDDERALLWVLRTDFALTGAKYGCGQGFCGACTVLVDGKAVRSCLTQIKKVAATRVVTIEGLASNGKLHPLQQAFNDQGAFQCGYCTSGMLLAAASFLQETPKPSRAAIISHMDSSLCRCGAHQRIVAAIESAAQRMGQTT